MKAAFCITTQPERPLPLPLPATRFRLFSRAATTLHHFTYSQEHSSTTPGWHTRVLPSLRRCSRTASSNLLVSALTHCTAYWVEPRYTIFNREMRPDAGRREGFAIILFGVGCWEGAGP